MKKFLKHKKLILITGSALLIVGGAWLFLHYGKQVETKPAANVRVSDSIYDLRKNYKDLVALVYAQNPSIALTELQKRMDADPIVFKNCHELAHQIGHEAIKKYKDFGMALQFQDATCSDGYMHGIIEETFGEQTGDITMLISKMQKLCDGLKGLSARCYHGVGHAMMFYTNNDLPKSLSYCQNYSDSHRNRCFEGAFMQNFLSDLTLHTSKYVDYKNPMSPCLNVASLYKPYCYFYAPIFYLNQNKNDYAKALTWCEAAQNGYKGLCAKGVGSLIVKYNAKDPMFGQKICSTSPRVKDCIAGMVSYGFTFYNSRAKVKAIICEPMDVEYKKICLSNL